jgi:putative sporulation protein YtxC
VVPVQLLSIGVIEPVEGFEDRLKLEFDLIKDEGIQITLKKNNRGHVLYYFCHMDDENLLKGNYNELRKMFFHCVANALSDIIINFWEPRIIKKIIKDNYFYFDKAEQEAIYENTEDILNFNENHGKKDFCYQIKRKTFVLHKILEYISNNNTIILDGFIKFRLKDYIDQLEEAVDKAIDEYLMEKEYKEFIKLLKLFVDLQEPKRDLVNVVIQNGEFRLLDDRMNLIEKDKGMDLFAQENLDVNLDDILVSTLINMAPRKIVIHGFLGKEKSEVVNALYNIFESRLIFCNHCDICRHLKPLKTK